MWGLTEGRPNDRRVCRLDLTTAIPSGSERNWAKTLMAAHELLLITPYYGNDFVTMRFTVSELAEPMGKMQQLCGLKF